MVQNATVVEITFFHSGYCTAHAFMVDPEKGKEKNRFYAVWALIKHPLHGYILFDSGYTKRFHEATSNFPEKLYALATPVVIEEGESALERLQSLRIQASEINYILLSHFHADHIGGLLDFPEAKLICSKKAMEEVQRKKRIAALRKGILQTLIPSDIHSRITYIEDIATKITDHESGLTFYDLYKDGSIQLVELPGHARGMLGVMLQSQKGKLLFASDASWSRDTFMHQVLPSKLATLFFDSWNEYRSTFRKLFLFQKQHPEITILFTHCPETMIYIASQHV